MKALFSVVLLSFATSAIAGGAPSVNESTGDLGYSHDFALPKARGRYQPALSLSYSSASNQDVGYGHGWSLSSSYIERDIKGRATLWVVNGKERKLLVATGSTYRPEVEDGYFEVTPNPNGFAYTAVDAAGNAYTYDRAVGWDTSHRSYLTKVTDLDGNITEYSYGWIDGVVGGTPIEDPVSIRYNNYKPAGATTWSYASTVVLERDTDSSLAPMTTGGILINQRARLKRVRIKGPGSATVRGYDLTYAAPGIAGVTSIASITEFGGEPSGPAGAATYVAAMPPTRFTYDFNGFDLAAPVAFGPIAPEGQTRAQWIDLDGDGRTDLVWGPEYPYMIDWGQGSGYDPLLPSGKIKWARNTTAIGASVPTFAAVAEIVAPGPVPSNNIAPYALTSELLDFDGDGVADLVRAWANGGRHQHSIYRGQVVNGVFSFSASAVTLDVTDVYPLHSTGQGSKPHVRPPYPSWVLADINGDGVLDYGYRWGTDLCGIVPGYAPCSWSYGLTVLDASSGALAVQGLPLAIAPGAWWYPTGLYDPQTWLGIDMNGDGLQDAVWVKRGAQGPVYPTTGDWAVALNDGARPQGMQWPWTQLPWASGGAPATAGYGDHPAITLCEGMNTGVCDAAMLPICGTGAAVDTRYTTGDLVDFNGDGRPDYVRNAQAILWNTGRTFAGSSLIGGPGASRYEHIAGGTWKGNTQCVPAVGCSRPDCDGWVGSPYRGQFVDLNGDGIPDFVRTLSMAPPVTLEFYRGANASGLPRPALLKRVETSPGAIYDIRYSVSTVFGAPVRARRPVVAAVDVSGNQVQPGQTIYWYAYGNQTPARLWYDPARVDERGFMYSWSQDATSRIVKYTYWATDSHALIGRAREVLTGSASNLATVATPTSAAVPPSQMSWFAQQIFGYGLKRLDAPTTAGCGAAGMDSTPAGYPMRVVPMQSLSARSLGAFSAVTDTRVACSDVDPNGNVLASTTTPSIADVPGKVLTTKQVLTGTTACRNVPLTLQVTRWDGATKLSEETRLFDASCRLLEQYATGTATPKTNRTTFTYAAAFFQMDTSVTGGVTRRLAYDPTYSLFVTEEYSEDSLTTLKTTSTYDAQTGFKLSSVGPVLVRQNNAVIASPQAGIARYYLYDLFGRTLAVAKSPFTAVGTPAYVPATLVPAVNTATNVVEAHQYLDTATPRATISHRYAAPQSYNLMWDPTPSSVEAQRSVAYRDGLGRVIQVRERLGGTGSGTRARVTQFLGTSANGYKVSQAVFLDGAGRAAVSLEPFYDTGEAFVDYRATAIPATRGTVTAFDAQGRPWCSTYQYVSGALPVATASCTSDSTQGSSFRLATETRYGGTTGLVGRGPFGGNFARVETIPPDQNVAGGSMKPSVRLLGPGGEELGLVDGEENRTWVERDAMGRETSSWRESGPRYTALATPQPVSRILYNLAGQAIEAWDANWSSDPTKMIRKSRYDEAGRLVYVTLDPATTEGIEYVFGAGDLGRVSKIREVTYPVPGGAAVTRDVAENHYDAPYSSSDAGYSFVAGKLSWTKNADTLIAYGYDDAARVWRRDQWFTKLGTLGDSTRRFTVSSTYGTDGRVLDSRVITPFSAAAEYQYFVDYDSAGRPVALSGKLASQASLLKVYEVVASQGPANDYGGYDALGRVPVMRADGGWAVSARRFNSYSGMLAGECKRMGDALACGTVSAGAFGAPPALDASKDIFRTDLVAATYKGAKLQTFEDSGAATRYTNTYLPNGRLQSSQAQPTSAVGSLTQDWLETFAFNGIGNIDRATAQRNNAAGDTRPDRFETQFYTPVSPAAGKALDKVSAVVSQLSATSGGALLTGAAAATPESAALSYDLLGHLTKVVRSTGEVETLVYAPGGELLYRQVGEKFSFYMGEYATITARGTAGCGASCVPQAATVEMDAHVVYAGTRIASVKPSRSLYYYRTRLGTVVATSTRVGTTSAFGAGYRYTPYGDVELSVNENDTTRSELGYTNALRLTGSLLYLKNRVYDAKARVFIQADTVDRLRYAYVWGDPVNLSDPSGLMPTMYWEGMAVPSWSSLYRIWGESQGLPSHIDTNPVPAARREVEWQTFHESEAQQPRAQALQNSQAEVDAAARAPDSKPKEATTLVLLKLNLRLIDPSGKPIPPELADPLVAGAEARWSGVFGKYEVEANFRNPNAPTVWVRVHEAFGVSRANKINGNEIDLFRWGYQETPQSELFIYTQAQRVGVLAHEVGHALGAKDQYDRKTHVSFKGHERDIMAGGAWGGAPLASTIREILKANGVTP